MVEECQQTVLILKEEKQIAEDEREYCIHQKKCVNKRSTKLTKDYGKEEQGTDGHSVYTIERYIFKWLSNHQ